MMKILVEDKPKTCSECLFCSQQYYSVHPVKCKLLGAPIMDPTKVRITDCPLKEVDHE
jgi:hypothetical protein